MKTKLLIVLSFVICLSSFGQISLVKDLNPGSNRSTFDYSFTFKNKLYTEATFDRKTRLIQTDGTENGTKILTFESLSFGTTVINEMEDYADNYLIVGDSLYITAGKTLVVTDGETTKGVSVDASAFNSFKSIKNFAAYKGDIYFSADYRVFTPSFMNFSQSLFKYDGKAISKIKDITSGGGLFTKSKISNSQYLFFGGIDNENGHELWRTDGTEAGTVLIKDIYPGTKSGLNFSLDHSIIFNDVLYFVADEGTNGKELWRSDGTEASTVSMIDTTASGDNNAFSSIGQKQYQNQSALMTSADKVLISAETENDDLQLYLTDGTSEGTTLVTLINEFGDAFYNDGGPH